MSAVDSCWCPDVVEDLHHHSPMLMREIGRAGKLPDMTIRLGEGISGLDQTLTCCWSRSYRSKNKSKNRNKTQSYSKQARTSLEVYIIRYLFKQVSSQVTMREPQPRHKVVLNLLVAVAMLRDGRWRPESGSGLL